MSDPIYITAGRKRKYKLCELVAEEVDRCTHRRRYCGYFMVKHELRRVLLGAYSAYGRTDNSTVATIYTFNGSCLQYPATRVQDGGLRIGCNQFSCKTTKIMAKWCGFNQKLVC